MEEQRGADIGGILNQTLSVMTQSPRDIALFVLLVGGMTALGVAFTLTSTAAMEFSPELSASVTPETGSALFDLLLGVVSTVAGFLLMRRYLAANGRSFGTANSFWPYFGMVILSVLGIILGLVLLIVPGIILMVRWSAASGHLISEDKGVTESLGASFEATKGSSWQIFFAALILLLMIAIFGGIVGGVFGILSFTVLVYVSAFLEALSSAVFLAFGIAVYLVLSDANEEVREAFS